MNVNQWKENGTASVQVADMIRNEPCKAVAIAEGVGVFTEE
jgi:ElaB/YqjD/DUF883 family membrane-anchored ribosome-binding protein